MLKNFPKTVLTARVEPALKEQLTDEAAQHDMTLSNYTEHVLRYFNTVLYDLQVCDEKNHSLQNQVNRLASDNNELCLDNEKWSALNVQLTSDKLTLSEGLQRYRGRVESLASQVNDLSSLNTEQDAQINDLIETIDDVSELNEDANRQINRLKLEVQTQTAQIQKIKKENELLVSRIEQSNDENAQLKQELVKRLPLVLKPNELEKVKAGLAELKNQHDDYTYSELLVLSLATTAANEKNKFSMYNLKDFKKRNPYFLTSKSLQQ